MSSPFPGEEEPTPIRLPDFTGFGGGGDSAGARRDRIRKRAVLSQLARLQAKPQKPKIVRRLAGITDLVEAARTLGLPTVGRTVRQTIRAVERLLGIDTNLKAIERGTAPDLSALASAFITPTPPVPVGFPAGPLPPAPPAPPVPRGPAPPSGGGAPPPPTGTTATQRAIQVARLIAIILQILRQRREASERERGGAGFPFPVPFPVPATGGPPMPFGQPFTMTTTPFPTGGGGGGDFLGGLGSLALDIARSFVPPPGPPTPIIAQPGALGAGLGSLGALGFGLAGGEEGVEGQFELIADLAGCPQLFRATESRVVPKSMVQLMRDGKVHTWLHATPKGWKINRSNVSGRRRHHHHPR